MALGKGPHGSASSIFPDLSWATARTTFEQQLLHRLPSLPTQGLLFSLQNAALLPGHISHFFFTWPPFSSKVISSHLTVKQYKV